MWLRGKNVRIDGEAISWELGEKQYDFQEAYKDGPHRELIMADTDDALRVFVHHWGPLRREASKGAGSAPLSTYRKERDHLRASIRLLGALESLMDLREALFNLVSVSDDRFDPVHVTLRLTGAVSDATDIQDWCRHASDRQIEKAATDFAEQLHVPGGKFLLAQNGLERVVRADLFVNNLAEAIRWMVWQDLLRKQPFEFCVECGRLIARNTQRARKFCDDPSSNCAKRWTDRNWKRRHRAAKRAASDPQSIDQE